LFVVMMAASEEQTLLPDNSQKERIDGDFGVEVVGGFTTSMKYIVCQFLEDKHYSQLHKALSLRWDREHSLSAAMKLMQQYGVVLIQTEIERLGALDEARQNEALVMKMPQQSNEKFQHFFLQLQLIVSTAQRVKQALEEGNPEQVEMALDDAESTGISPYILKMAIVQAGSQVKMLRAEYEGWIKDTDNKLAKLIHGQDDAILAQKRLATAQAQLTSYQGASNEKAQKVLMGFTAGNSKALLAAAFHEWAHYIKTNKEEASIREEYEARIEAAENRLVESKSKQLQGVRNVLKKKAHEGDMSLLEACFKVFRDTVEEGKWVKENGDKIKQLEDQLHSFKSSQLENTKRVLGRMSAEGDNTLVDLCFKGWINYRLEYLKDKEANDAIKAAQNKLNAFMKGHQENAKALLDKMSSGTDSGLVNTMVTAWVQQFIEDKQEKELEDILNSADSKFKLFSDRNSTNATSVMERARLHMEEMVYRRHWNAWRLYARMEATEFMYRAKIEAKKQQLYGVQQMFRQFAAQLEAGMKEQDSARELYKRRTKTLSKSDGTVSLPDIHSSRYESTPKTSSRVGGSRQAWAS